MEEKFYNLLIQNVAYQLRHPNYDSTIGVRKFARKVSLNEGHKEDVLKYRRSEADTLKEQRLRLYNPNTAAIIARARKYWKRLYNTDGQRVNITVGKSDESRLEELQAEYYNFMPGETIEQAQNRIVEVLGVTDPNAWIVYERDDRRNEDGAIMSTKVYMYIVNSANALNFSMSAGVLNWFLFRSQRVETVVDSGVLRSKWLEDFFLYVPGGVYRLREQGENTTQEAGEMLVNIRVVGPPPKYGDTPSDTPTPPIMPQTGDRTFYFKYIPNGTTEVPALHAGVYVDERSDLNTPFYTTWFAAAEGVFADLIRDKSVSDVLRIVYAYPRRHEYVKPCTHIHPDHGQCVGGFYGGSFDEELRCIACGGSGRAKTSTTEQEVMQLGMPETPEEMVELSKMSFTEPVDISLLQHIDAKIDDAEARAFKAIFDAGLYEAPTGTKTKTATEVNAVLDGIADVLAPFAAHLSRHIELGYRIGAQYKGFVLQIDHSFPEKLSVYSVSDLLSMLKAARESAAGYDTIFALRMRLLQKMYEGDEATQKAMMARYKFLPFDDKSAEDVTYILAGRDSMDSARVLWENWREIFIEIGEKHPEFAQYTHERQKAVVGEMVDEFKANVVPVGQQVEPAPEPAQAIDDINDDGLETTP